ncbi:hypothetical protein GWK91_00720 [Virgibacillus sp. MSP4-1]|uniref:Uncharacterized protein n=1 Tax=Salinibacillus aidingensis TaxID=237684 RepID=A0ABP3L064_9BACI|nr:hypothetical protein [Virgibacillus sp. MSP4-1]QHS21568.1 hypothetical protein GWK91_00720 [Virgibacillus sp. MSP4-1]
MEEEEKRVSKLYRRILTSDETQGLITFQRLDRNTQEKVKRKMVQNGSNSAYKVLRRINNLQEID